MRLALRYQRLAGRLAIIVAAVAVLATACFIDDADTPGDQFIAISAGEDHNCGITTNSTVWCWGRQVDQCRLGVRPPRELSPRSPPDRAIRAGSATTAPPIAGATTTRSAIFHPKARSPPSPREGCDRAESATTAPSDAGPTAGTTLRCRQAPRPASPPSLRAGARTSAGFSTTALWNAGGDGSWPDPPEGRFTEVSVGLSHACAIRDDGTVACWGDNAGGRAEPPGRPVHGHLCWLGAHVRTA